jgi:hypothetical protein
MAPSGIKTLGASLLAVALLPALCFGQDKPDLSSPKAAAKTFGDALIVGDVARAKAVSVGNERQGTILEAMVNLVGGMKKLEDAMIAKYGREAFKSGNSPVSSDAMQDALKRLGEGEVKVSGDTAVITPKKKQGADPGHNEPWTLKKVGSEWKVDLGSITKALEESGTADEQVEGMKAFRTMVQGMTTEVAAGKYKTLGEANEAVKQAFIRMGAELAAKQQKAGPQPGAPPKQEEAKKNGKQGK